jgi:hypothetical protein
MHELQASPQHHDNTLRPAAGDTPTSRTANLVIRRCTRSASPVTCLQKIATTFSLTTHLHPELKRAPDMALTPESCPKSEQC